MKDKKPKILWYVHGADYEGGGERVYLEGGRCFSDLNLDCQFLMSRPGRIEKFMENPYYSRIQFQFANTLPKFIYKIPALGKLFEYFGVIKKIYQFNPDFIIANGQFEVVIYSLFSRLAFKKRIPFACFIHGSFYQFSTELLKYTRPFKKHFKYIIDGDDEYKKVIPVKRPKSSLLEIIWAELKAQLYYRYVRNTKSVFVLSNKNRLETELLYGISNVKVFHGAFPRTILENNTLNSLKHQAYLNTQSPVFFTISRLVPKKRVDTIIMAFQLFLKREPNAKLIIAGEGSEQQKLKELTRELGCNNSIEFVGFISENEMGSYYQNCDAFISADNADYNITTIMALAYQRKVIVPNQNEFDIDFEGIFKSEVSPEKYDQAMIRAIKSNVDFSSKEFQSFIKEYSWENYFEKIIQHLSSQI